jgi:hypothetical protein
MLMLTRKQLLDLRNQCGEFGPSDDAIHVVLDELEQQRAIILAALKCTGPDAHDGFTNLVVAAEDYLDSLKKEDTAWETASVYENLKRGY